MTMLVCVDRDIDLYYLPSPQLEAAKSRARARAARLAAVEQRLTVVQETSASKDRLLAEANAAMTKASAGSEAAWAAVC